MTTPFVHTIEKKRDGHPLSREDIAAFARGAADSSLPDEQLAALLMAIRINGMNPEETANLSLAMAASGQQADLSPVPGVKVDKHSTGGVGDTTTLVALPLAAACGAKVVKMSGRALGHTGGTLDKLWSISGMRTDLSIEEMIRQTNAIGLSVGGQTADLAPADKKLYALRDVTATVDSMPLIASSILSKKIAAGADAIVLDVKHGSGALMTEFEDALELARTMVDIGRRAGRRMTAIVSDMNQPLGDNVGNALEVREAIEILQGRKGGNLLELSLLLSTQMLLLCGIAETHQQAKDAIQQALESGAGLAKMAQWIQAQGGDARVTEDVSLLPQAKLLRAVRAPEHGYVTGIRCDAIGLAANSLGAGRLRQEDAIDYSVGLVLQKRLGDKVAKGEPLCTLHGNDADALDAANQQVLSAFTIAAMPMPVPPLVREILFDQD